MQRLVMVLILEPVTPGALRTNIDWSRLSSSATADDMAMGVPELSLAIEGLSRKSELTPRELCVVAYE